MTLRPPPNQQPIQGAVPQVWQQWFALISRSLSIIRLDNSLEPATLSDSDASSNSIYYSSDQNKLVYKDFSGVVNDLY